MIETLPSTAATREVHPGDIAAGAAHQGVDRCLPDPCRPPRPKPFFGILDEFL